MAKMKARESSRDATSSSMRGAAELVQPSMAKEFEVGYFKALTILSRALSTKLEELEIPYYRVNKALLYSLSHSF